MPDALRVATTPHVNEGPVYELDKSWPKLPEGMVLSDVSGIALDDSGSAYIFNRSKDPVVIVDSNGDYVGSWGHGIFKRPHGAAIGPDQTLWLTDDGDHTVRQFTLDGRLLSQIGVTGQPGPFMSGQPFNRPTHTAFSPSGEIYVSDGYGNSRIHKFAPDGRHLLSWGSPGAGPGEFNLPHNITCDDQGRVYVADRENFRVQIFDSSGHFIAQWHHMYRPQGMFTTRGSDPITYVGENGPATAVDVSVPNLGARISIYDKHGVRIGRIGGWQPGLGDFEFLAPHSVVVDDQGSIFVGEVSWNTWPKKFPNEERPAKLRSLRKFQLVSA